MLRNDFLALILTFALSLAWLRLNDFFAQFGWVSSSLSRKIIHMGTGPLFVLCWLLFTDAPLARFLAALVPLAITCSSCWWAQELSRMKPPSRLCRVVATGEKSCVDRSFMGSFS